MGGDVGVAVVEGDEHRVRRHPLAAEEAAHVGEGDHGGVGAEHLELRRELVGGGFEDPWIELAGFVGVAEAVVGERRQLAPAEAGAEPEDAVEQPRAVEGAPAQVPQVERRHASLRSAATRRARAGARASGSRIPARAALARQASRSKGTRTKRSAPLSAS